MRTQHDKVQMLDTLRRLLRDAFQLRATGGAYAKLARAHGYIDGYTQMIVDAGIADHRELLALVSEERRRADGPSTAVVTPELEPEVETNFAA